MRIRTTELLLDAIAKDFAWRKKELSTVKFMVDRFELKPRVLSTALRAGIALLYAHWEGFLKTSAELYLEYVAEQNLFNSQLADNLLAISARKAIHSITESSKVSQGLALVEFFRRKLSETATVPYKNTIQTQSNLSSIVLKDISTAIGVNYSLFVTKSALIDERLVANRNNIAHGQTLEIDVADFVAIFQEVTAMMELWRNELENACVTKRFLNVAS